jgi:hypothetical protein
MAPPPPSLCYRELRVASLGTLFFLTPLDAAGDVAGPALSVELAHGVAGLAAFEAPAGLGAPPTTAWAVLGCARLISGLALALVTGAEQVAVVRGHPVFRATKVEVHAPPAAHPDDARYVALLRRGLDPSRAGRGLFFSYGADLTLTSQAAAKRDANAPTTLHARADPAFWWNKALAEPLLTSEAEAAYVAPFIIPFIAGHVSSFGPVPLAGGGAPATLTMTLIARRATSRPGVRHWRRGVDGGGAVANAVETEQIASIAVLRPDGAPTARPCVASFVQARGSIPLLWSQAPHLKYKPTTRVAPPSLGAAAFTKHFDTLTSRYGDVVAVNLANAHGSEGALGDAYAAAVAALPILPGGAVRYVGFDFHAVCGATRYDRLESLWEEVGGDVAAHSYFYAPGDGAARPVPREQTGVVRTNCIDCLDRTNVVQGWLARRALGAALTDARGGSPDEPLAVASPAAEAAFKGAWADHGDDVSRQYAGTGALKSGFTRTGKRGLAGLLDDGAKSLARYYLNNFRDGGKQDALDYTTGAYAPSKDRPSPFASQPSPALALAAVALSLALAVSGARSALTGGVHGVRGLLRAVAAPLVAAAGILQAVRRNGKKLVNKPQLLPEAAAPW